MARVLSVLPLLLLFQYQFVSGFIPGTFPQVFPDSSLHSRRRVSPQRWRVAPHQARFRCTIADSASLETHLLEEVWETQRKEPSPANSVPEFHIIRPAVRSSSNHW
eukprot:3838197-Rhodomonas_salina.1